MYAFPDWRAAPADEVPAALADWLGETGSLTERLVGLGRAFAEKSDYDVDTLLLYDAGQSPAQVARAVQSILKSGRSVRAEQSAPEGLRVRQTLRLGPDGAVPVTGGGGIC